MRRVFLRKNGGPPETRISVPYKPFRLLSGNGEQNGIIPAGSGRLDFRFTFVPDDPFGFPILL